MALLHKNFIIFGFKLVFMCFDRLKKSCSIELIWTSIIIKYHPEVCGLQLEIHNVETIISCLNFSFLDSIYELKLFTDQIIERSLAVRLEAENIDNFRNENFLGSKFSDSSLKEVFHNPGFSFQGLRHENSFKGSAIE